jgi:hypothetical protein
MKMIAATARTSFSTMPLARMAGHRKGYRVLNGDAQGTSPLEREFRYRMHELCGEALQAGQSVSEAERLACLGDLWKHIYGLHEFFGQSNRVDDLITLLMMSRREWRGLVLDPEKVDVLRKCLDAMATRPHTTELMIELGNELESAGVDLNSGL